MSGPILVTGGRGQVATALAAARPDRVVVVGRPAFDFDRPETLAEVIERHGPALVVNAAAWTAVDAAEAEPEAADRANHTGPAILARACQARGVGLIHLSTDYVFDGLKGAPYGEEDPTGPGCVYGRTKLAGEAALQEAHPGAVVLRTSWVYARQGRNFVRTMLGAARRAPVLRVVADQHGCPTNADDLAAAILQVADALLAGGGDGRGGTFHAAGGGAGTSWHDFARAIFDAAAPYWERRPQVLPITTGEWPTPARRPPDSRLDCRKLADTFGVRLPPWKASLPAAVDAICRELDEGG